jgi:hypothetical protein
MQKFLNEPDYAEFTRNAGAEISPKMNARDARPISGMRQSSRRDLI